MSFILAFIAVMFLFILLFYVLGLKSVKSAIPFLIILFILFGILKSAKFDIVKYLGIFLLIIFSFVSIVLFFLYFIYSKKYRNINRHSNNKNTYNRNNGFNSSENFENFYNKKSSKDSYSSHTNNYNIWNNKSKYYKILNIPLSATLEEVKKAYRNLIKQHHPDKFMNAPQDEKKYHEKKMKEINEAYDYIEKLYQ